MKGHNLVISHDTILKMQTTIVLEIKDVVHLDEFV